MGKSSQKIFAILGVLAALLSIHFSLAVHEAAAADNPHNGNNTIQCITCHNSAEIAVKADWWTDQASNVCGQCHNAAAEEGVDVVTHHDKNGNTLVQCTMCHNPHNQMQNRTWKDASYLETGVIATITASGLTRVTGAPAWTTDQFKNMVLIPNVRTYNYTYRIESNDANSITIKTSNGDAITTAYAPAGSTFAIVYGKLIKEKVANRTVKFFRPTGTNSFADGDAVIDGVCQVCHTKTALFTNNGVLSNGTHPAAPGDNCKGCHNHDKTGFGSGCGSCHAVPPTTPETMAKASTGSAGPTGSLTPGAHTKHATSAGMGYNCSFCHANSNGTGPSHNNSDISIGFSLFNGQKLGGTFNGQSAATYTSSDGGLTTVTNTGSAGNGTITCSNIYCHSTVQPNGGGAGAVSYATPAWDGGPVACGSCHATVAGSPRGAIASGSHAGHLQGAVQCSACHDGAGNGTAGSYPATHVDYSIAVANQYSSDGTPGNGYGTCSTASCHSNVYGAGSVLTPEWGTTGNGCGACHTTNPIAALGPDTGSHTKHMSISGAACILCHNAGTTATTVPATEHADTLIDTANVGYTDEKAKGSAFTTCSTASCHGSSSPIWGVNTPNNTCTKCHGTGTVSVTAANRYVVAPPTNVAGNPGMLTGVGQVSNDAKVGAHQTHLQLFNGMTGTNVADYDQRCSFCHGTLPVSGNHANGSSTPVFSGLSTTAGMNGAAFVGGTTCNNIYCHNPAGTNGTNGTLNLVNAGTGTAPVWTNAAYLGDIRKTQANCGVCHKSPGDGGFTSSTTHGFTITQSCTGCHEHDGDLNGTVGRRHMDGVLYGGGNCDSCHGYGPTASDGKAERAVEGKGVHEKHVPHLVARWGGALNPAADQFGAGASWTNVCGVCHNGAIHSTGEAIGGTGRTISIPGAYQFGANPPVYKGTIGVSSATTPKTCSNVSCHFRETPVWSAL